MIGVLADDATNKNIELPILPVTLTRWDQWQARNPDSKILSLETGFDRNYDPGAVYADYFASDELEFPSLIVDKNLSPKDFVFGMRLGDKAKAWPVEAFTETPVINDQLGNSDIVLIGDTASRTVRAYQRNGLKFSASSDEGVISNGGESWRITEKALIGPEGRQLKRLPGHLAYWFAWASYVGDSALYKP